MSIRVQDAHEAPFHVADFRRLKEVAGALERCVLVEVLRGRVLESEDKRREKNEMRSASKAGCRQEETSQFTCQRRVAKRNEVLTLQNVSR